ncbi:hypothetical protein NDU88_006049 [Pleurodeles waltl]|uniref:Uncharacterized protein n=1 Tax=Pleurodeles waltl TaxID=8319 RepID=A0AAV7TYC4_PLEWA|nr:hypothetical protein NDU88_006049 [Pleurodeles waltl]
MIADRVTGRNLSPDTVLFADVELADLTPIVCVLPGSVLVPPKYPERHLRGRRGAGDAASLGSVAPAAHRRKVGVGETAPGASWTVQGLHTEESSAVALPGEARPSSGDRAVGPLRTGHGER